MPHKASAGRVASFGALAATAAFVGVAVFQRYGPRHLVRLYWKVVNPLFRAAAGFVPGLVLIETIGRRTGRVHRVPVAAKLEDNALWLVVGHAGRSSYLRNIEADPRVRVRVLGKWRRGMAVRVHEDDARRRARNISLLNAAFLQIATSDMATVRVDLSDA